jgi:hypothetical protein
MGHGPEHAGIGDVACRRLAHVSKVIFRKDPFVKG